MQVGFYNYYWGFTIAQIELMMADLPLIVYPKKNGNGADGGRKGFTTPKRVNDNEYGKELAAWQARARKGVRPEGLDLQGFKIGFKSGIGD